MQAEGSPTRPPQVPVQEARQHGGLPVLIHPQPLGRRGHHQGMGEEAAGAVPGQGQSTTVMQLPAARSCLRCAVATCHAQVCCAGEAALAAASRSAQPAAPGLLAWPHRRQISQLDAPGVPLDPGHLRASMLHRQAAALRSGSQLRGQAGNATMDEERACFLHQMLSSSFLKPRLAGYVRAGIDAANSQPASIITGWGKGGWLAAWDPQVQQAAALRIGQLFRIAADVGSGQAADAEAPTQPGEADLPALPESEADGLVDLDSQLEAALADMPAPTRRQPRKFFPGSSAGASGGRGRGRGRGGGRVARKRPRAPAPDDEPELSSSDSESSAASSAWSDGEEEAGEEATAEQPAPAPAAAARPRRRAAAARPPAE